MRVCACVGGAVPGRMPMKGKGKVYIRKCRVWTVPNNEGREKVDWL